MQVGWENVPARSTSVDEGLRFREVLLHGWLCEYSCTRTCMYVGEFFIIENLKRAHAYREKTNCVIVRDGTVAVSGEMRLMV